MKPPRGAIAALLEGRHDDPFSLLGVHAGPKGAHARVWIPGADSAEAHDLAGRSLGALVRLDDRGLFEGTITGDPQPLRYRAAGGGVEWWVTDPYSFGPVLGPIDDVLMAEGTHLRLHDKLGAHLISHEGAQGVHFAVWAPNAQRVSVVGDFNDWDGRRHAMRKRGGVGVWEIFVPDIAEYRAYKYEIVGADGQLQPLKADPFAFAAELRPATASITRDPVHDWGDADHRAHWAAIDPRRVPISIYEVHAGSWDRDANGWFLSWDALADRLIPYVVDLGFTHIEFLPVSEHPYDPSWGYQTTGLYAPSARFGDVDGFARFVDGAHRAGIGVLLDWVPAHFPTDAFGLAKFDGTPLYEHADPREGFHRDWNTFIYNHGRNEVRAFLIGSALFWLEHYHADALRVDAVASMLYRDYSRPAGEWVPNIHGGRENLEAIHFFHELSRAVTARVPGAILIAEESTAFPSVSRPVDQGGLGFDFKWNMGWMHDSLHYLEEQPINRAHHHGMLTFGLVYAFSENFVLPLSHDEVVYGKGSLIRKMPGDTWQRFANLRAYFGFMWSHPGKKLLFMGGEFAQDREWNHDAGLDWFLLDDAMHRGVQSVVRDLNGAYRANPALHVRDCRPDGFSWVVMDDADQSVFAYLRLGEAGDPPVLAVCNFTPVPRFGYRLGVPHVGIWTEIVNTDASIYGGSGLGNDGQVAAEAVGAHGHPASLSLTLPPLSTLILRAGP